MLRSAVSLVVGELEAGITHVQLLHHGIAAGFRENRGGADGAQPGVAFDDRFDCAAEFQILDARQLVAINLDVGWAHRQAQQRTAHGQERRAQDVETVDFVAVGPGNGPRQRAFANDGREALALFGAQHLGIAETVNPAVGIQDHGGSDDRTGKRPPARFINTGTADAFAASLVNYFHPWPAGLLPRTRSRIALAAPSAPPRRKTSCTARNSRVSSPTC